MLILFTINFPNPAKVKIEKKEKLKKKKFNNKHMKDYLNFSYT